MIVASMSVAFAEDHDDAVTKTDGAPRYSTTNSGNLEKDTTLTVGGLEAGDQITYYKVVEWVNNTGWALTSDFTGTGELTTSDLDSIKAGTINWELANKIAGCTASGTDGGSVGTGSTEWSKDVEEPGLYMVVIAAAKSGVIYNPVFVAIDYYENDSSVITLSDNAEDYSDGAMAKKEVITLTKDADTITTTNVGGDVHFTVNTTIPKYPSNYTGPVFTLFDKLSAGLTLKPETITVYPATTATGTPLEVGADKAYTKPDTEGYDYTIAFNTAYIQSLTAPQPITVTYTATINGDVEQSVNPEDNTVTLHYSNEPTDTTGSGRLKDVTEHYTFTIDGKLLGENSWKNTEVVKVGIDAEGNEITETRTLSNGYSIGALQGATFTLYKGEGFDTENKTGTVHTYTYKNAANETVNFDGSLTSDADGRINIRGLASGTYYIVETNAPAGYIKDNKAYKVEIIPTTNTKTITETIDGIPVTYDVEYLESYVVKIDNVQTASYTITNMAEGTASQDAVTAQSASEGDNVVGHDGLIGATGAGDNAAAGKIKNVRGVELPSTGGMGTTILYVGGSILVILAAILLITKRRMSADE